MTSTTYSSNIPIASQALLNAVHTAGLRTDRNESSLSSPLVLFEANETSSSSLTAQSASELIENLRTGGSLLFTLNPYAGQSVFHLTSVLPSTGFTTILHPSSFAPADPISITPVDEDFFSDASIEGLRVPLGFDIRPTSAAERGQARYERFDLTHPILKTEVPARSDLWSRPLINREWSVRARYDNFTQLPLLVTGRYGAGRVAMLATTANALGESAAAQAFWQSVLRWLLTTTQTSSTIAQTAKPTLATSYPQPGAIRLTLSNLSTAPLPVQLVIRVLDENGAILPDGTGDLLRSLTLSPTNSTTLDLPLPTPTIPNLEITKAETTFQVRAALLSFDGSSLLVEQRTVSPPNPISLRVETDNLYAIPYPFHAPGPDALVGFQSRMGIFTSAYAYLPGAELHGAAVLSFQNTNLAPLSQIQDLTQPENPSIMALNDRATGLRQPPSPDRIQAYGTWNGKLGNENVLQITLPSPAQLTMLTLVGSFGTFANAELHNPGRAVIELDGRPIAAVEDLDQAFAADYGQARIALPTTVATIVTIRLPWIERHAPADRPRAEPWLGEIILEGWPLHAIDQQSLSGRLAVDLVDALSGEHERLVTTHIRLHACESNRLPFTVTLPNTSRPRFFRLEAHLDPNTEPRIARSTSAPVLVIMPQTTLRPFTDLRPPGTLGVGLNVTNGFKKFFPIGTGTNELLNGWSHPDDLVWAYSRLLKEVPPNAHTPANRLYAAETDMRHYSTPWHEFPNGELFFSTSIGGLVDYLKQMPGWQQAPLIQLTFADRWTIGPDLRSCNSWQEYLAFDSYLRDTTGQRLFGATHSEIKTSIHTTYKNQWQAWQLQRYMRSIRSICEAFRAVDKNVSIYAQGFPMVAGELGRELAQTIRGMHDDFTWGMQENSPTLTTGRNLGEIAFNPVWQTTNMMPWGFVSSVFNNWQWHTPVATTEPTRRLLYNRAWRGIVWTGGRYGPLAKYGYSANVGTPYTVSEEEFQQWWKLQQLGSLLQPEAPLGAGLVISTQKNARPQSTRFNCGDATTMAEPRLLMQAFRSLHEAGLSIPFAANASTLTDWPLGSTTPLILLNLQDFSDDELASLATLQSVGTPIAAFAQRSTLAPSAAAIFARPNTFLIEQSPATLTHEQAVDIADTLQSTLQLPLRFSPGTAGYGFRCQQTILVVVEDWLEQARLTTVRLRKSHGAQRAMASNANDHSTLSVSDDGEFWNIVLPLRSADGVLIAIQEI